MAKLNPMMKAIDEYWYKKSTKTTIRHLEIQKEPIGTSHNIWNCVKQTKIRYTKSRS
jgi:hypothetical protein